MRKVLLLTLMFALPPALASADEPAVPPRAYPLEGEEGALLVYLPVGSDALDPSPYGGPGECTWMKFSVEPPAGDILLAKAVFRATGAVLSHVFSGTGGGTFAMSACYYDPGTRGLLFSVVWTGAIPGGRLIVWPPQTGSEGWSEAPATPATPDRGWPMATIASHVEGGRSVGFEWTDTRAPVAAAGMALGHATGRLDLAAPMGHEGEAYEWVGIRMSAIAGTGSWYLNDTAPEPDALARRDYVHALVPTPAGAIGAFDERSWTRWIHAPGELTFTQIPIAGALPRLHVWGVAFPIDRTVLPLEGT